MNSPLEVVKRLLLLLLLTCLGISLPAQDKSWDNWYFGIRLGMAFGNGQRQVVTDNQVSTNYGAACVSDPVTGGFLFMTDGDRCYDRNFDPMSLSSGVNTPVYSFIVPNPANTALYYVFIADNSHQLFYLEVDMRLRGGLGDLTGPKNVLRTNADHHFTVVRRYYDNGFWLITHTMGSDEFQVFAITADGLDPNPVVSRTGATSSTGAVYVSGNMVSNHNGTRITHCFAASNQLARAQELEVDKKCGTLNYLRDFTMSDPNADPKYCHAAYSKSGKFLFMCWSGFSQPEYNFIQYNTDEPDPDVARRSLIQITFDSPYRLALAPDGLIYVTSAENSAVTPKISAIENADNLNALFRYHLVNLNQTTDYRYVENWPPFILDWSDHEAPAPDRPKLDLHLPCLGDSSSFNVSGNFQPDSFYWETGDGSLYRETAFKHLYSQAGSYSIRFTWYRCGNKYVLTENRNFGSKPKFNLGSDTVMCHGTELRPIGPHVADSYLWSNGDITYYTSIDTPGIYWLKAGIGDCYSYDTLIVDYRPPILVELGQGHYLCEDEEGLVKLDAGKNFDSYLWTPTGDTTQWIIVNKSGNYYVVVKDFHGCPGNDATHVERRCPLFLEIPGAFSPNGDNLNDVFIPVFTDVLTYEIRIYNRWGQEIFVSTHPADGWNGSHQNRFCPNGVYTYRLNYSGYSGGRIRKYRKNGVVHLLR